MIYRTIVLAGILSSAAAASSAPLVPPQAIQSFPSIPHGLDWSIIMPPRPEIPEASLSLEEVKSLLPPVFSLGRTQGVLAMGPLSQPHDGPPINPFIGMIVGTAFLLAAYDLIPRIHSHVLRFRSVNLNRDLLG